VTLIGGIEAGRMGFGCFALSGSYGSADEQKGIETINAALDLGLVLLDTSDAYAAGRNEELVGNALAARRNEAVLATKFGWVLDSSGAAVKLDSSPQHVREACEASLRRLRTDHIDVYIQHRVDPSTPIDETVAALIRLRDEGKIRTYGLSEAGAETIRRANSVAPVAALQTEYSLWSREPEAELLPLCVKLGIAFIAYSPLGRGFLSGAVRSTSDLEQNDFRRTHPRFQDENIQKNVALVDRLTGVAASLGCTTAQVALAWLLTQPGSVIPIPATRSKEHLRDNAKALEVRLSQEALDAIAIAFPASSVAGARHPADHMKTIGR
jgi:aryl-alcohol dehydrogenase-like predicted oxidoreductase